MKISFPFFFSIAISCGTISSAEVFLTNHAVEKTSTGLIEYSPNDRWVYFFNNKIEFIDSLYLPKAILVSANGEIYDTENKRNDFYRNLKANTGTIKSIATIKRIEITPELDYEIGFFVNSKNIKFKHLIIWKKVQGVFLREIEMISKSENETTDITGIQAARNLWMDYCNHHRVKDLVTNTYFENAVYYNNGRITLGTKNIEKEYRYMTNPSYQLTLTPIVLETVNKSLAFEIGQCSGSYKGKYVLIWGKRNGASWKAIFDSN